MFGQKILLRAVEPEDADILIKWENNPEIWIVGHTLMPFSRYAINEYIKKSGQDIYSSQQLRLMIESKENGLAVGCIDLYDFDPHNRRAGLGIIIDNSAQGQGFASEAIHIITSYAFDTLHLHQLFAEVDTTNLVSVNLFIKSNFTIIGTRKEWHLFNNEWHDTYLFQKLNHKQ